MNNFILLLINALSAVGVFTKEESEELWDEMRYATLPDSFEGSYQLIEKIFAKVEIDKKVSTNLDEKVLALETAVKDIPKDYEELKNTVELLKKDHERLVVLVQKPFASAVKESTKTI